MNLLTIKNLKVEVDGKQILKGLDLDIGAWETHVIMGPNGSGKSTLVHTLAGHPNYKVTDGQVTWTYKSQEDLLQMSIDERAKNGLFIGFQYPVEIPGISNMAFMRAASNAIQQHKGYGPWDAIDFLSHIKGLAKTIEVDEQLLYRSVNEGFSGGEKKRNEVLQMLILNPVLSIFDEIDSGLDIDAMKQVADGINSLSVRSDIHSEVIITHYPQLLEHIRHIDKVHIILDGRIVKSSKGNKESRNLIATIGNHGYAWLEESHP